MSISITAQGVKFFGIMLAPTSEVYRKIISRRKKLSLKDTLNNKNNSNYFIVLIDFKMQLYNNI